MVRVAIPSDVAAKVLVAHDRTCCACNDRGKHIQIHHIDEDNANSDESNLAVLCFECHGDTMVTGGFGRKLDAAQVARYRDEWVARVAERKRKADELLVEKQVGVIRAATAEATEWRQLGEIEMAAYIDSIPDTMQRAYELAQPEWGSANLIKAQATYQVISVAERMWIGLSAWYPPHHFSGRVADDFISQYTDGRFDLRHALMEPAGPGTGGSMMKPMIAYGVLLDVQELVFLTVRIILNFSTLHTKINQDKWQERFREAIRGYERAGH